VKNLGTIATPGASPNNGVELLHGGVLVNGTGGSTTGLISATGSGIYAGGHLITVGTGGTPVYYARARTNGTNYGTIRGPGTFSAVRIVSGGTVNNQGLISASAAYATGISLGGTVTGTVLNFGTVIGPTGGTTGQAVFLGAGGLVVNYASGLLESDRAV